MKYIKLYRDEVKDKIVSTPFLGVIKEEDKKAKQVVYGSPKTSNETTQLKKWQNSNKLYPEGNIVVGKGLPLNAMPYLWYWNSEGNYTMNQFIANQKNVYVNGERVNDYFGKGDNERIILYLGNDILVRMVKKVEDDNPDNIYLETKPFDGNGITTSPGIIINHYKIKNVRTIDLDNPEELNDLTKEQRYKLRNMLHKKMNNKKNHITFENTYSKIIRDRDNGAILGTYPYKKYGKMFRPWKSLIKYKLVNIAKRGRWKSKPTYGEIYNFYEEFR